MRIFCASRDGRSGAEAAYALLGSAFRTLYEGAVPEIKKTANGKPFFPDRPEIHFSLSHSRTHVLCAVSPAPVGVDIESPRDISARAVNYFSSPYEQELFEPLDLWVLKESFIKLIGGTLALMKTLRFSQDWEVRDFRDPASRSSAAFPAGNANAGGNTRHLWQSDQRVVPEGHADEESSADCVASYGAAVADRRVTSGLYRVDGCRAAVSVYSLHSAELSNSIELIIGSLDSQ